MFESRFSGPSGTWKHGGYSCQFYCEDGCVTYIVYETVLSDCDFHDAMVSFDVRAVRDRRAQNNPWPLLQERHFMAWVDMGRPDRSWLGKTSELSASDLERMWFVRHHTKIEPRFSSPEALEVAFRLAGGTLPVFVDDDD